MITKNDIIVYIPTYHDHNGLVRALLRLKQMGLQSLVGIGRFEDFPDLGEDTKSVDICEDFGSLYFVHEPLREEQKLNKAFQIADKKAFEVFIYHGSDAYLEGDIDRFIANLNEEWDAVVYKYEPRVLKLKVVEHHPKDKWNADFRWVPRIHMNYGMMEARYLHWILFNKKETDSTKWINDPYAPIISGLVIHHDNSVRDKSRDELMTKYQDKNVPRERDLYNMYCAEKHFKDGIKVLYAKTTDDYVKLRIQVIVDNYTHLVLLNPGYDFTEENKQRLESTLTKYNNIHQHIQALSGVHSLGSGNYRVSDKKQERKFPTERLEQIYNGVNKVDEKEELIVVPYVFGPLLCLENDVVKLFSVINEPEDFVWFCNDLSIPIYLDTKLQLEKH